MVWVNDGEVERVSELGCEVSVLLRPQEETRPPPTLSYHENTKRIHEEPGEYSRWLQRKYTEPDNSFPRSGSNQ